MVSDSVFVGYAATVTTCATLVPQIVKVIKTKECEDLSYLMIFLNLSSNALWMTYGILNDRMPLIVAGAVTLTSAVSLLGLKVFYRKRPQMFLQSTVYVP